MNLYEKIENLCKNRGETITTMCKMAGIPRAPLSDLKMGRTKSLSSKTLSKISEYFSVSIDYLLGINDAIEDGFAHPDLRPITLKKFRMLGEIACGEPIYASEDHETYIDASANINADFCLTAKGDSMTGAKISDGDIVFIKEQPIVDNGQIAAVIINDEVTLKRWYFYPEKKKLVLNPENPKYEPLVYVGDELNEIRCLGRAVSLMCNL